MALGEAGRQGVRRGWDARRVRRQALTVPEALALLVLLAAGVVWGMHPLLGLLVALVAAVFATRLGLLALAEHLLARGDYRSGQRLLDGALRLNPWSADALLLRAHGLTLQGHDEEAERTLRRALELDPDDEIARAALAGALLAQGRYYEGRQLATAQGFDRAAPLGVQQRAWLALHIDNDPERAQALLNACDPERFPPRVSLPLLVTRCESELALDDAASAGKTLELIETRLCLCAVPQQAELLFHIGRIKTQLGLAAIADFRRSVELDPAGRWAQAAWRCAVDSA